jgi:hypothetical protein
VRDFAWILGVKAFLENKAGHSDDAWRAVQTQLRLTNALRAEPMVVNQLVRATMTDATCTTIQMLCRVTPPTSQQVHDAEQLFKGFDSIDPLVRAADGERLIFGEWLFGLPKSELSKEAQADLVRSRTLNIFHRLLLWRVMFKPLFLADHAAYLEWSRKCVHLLQDPNVLDKTDAFTNEFFTTQKHHFLTLARAPAAVAKTTRFHLGVVAAVRITLTGLTLLQYKQAHGDFPESLDALGVQNVEDPFSKKPLIYHREGGGFVLYSVGQDRKDNGGAPKQPKGTREYDIVWRFPGNP